jgi:hypothetical protein
VTASPRNRKLDTISDRIYRASVNSTAAFAFLNEQRSHIPTLAAATTDGAGHSRGSHSDPTLRTVTRLSAIEEKRTAIQDMIATLELGTDLLDEAIRDAYRISSETIADGPTTDDRPLCRGGTPDTWGDATCGRHQDHYSLASGEIRFRGDGLCAMHRKRKERWERNGTIEGAA